MSLSLQNYIYNGEIRHRRFTPFEHFFSYPLFMVYVDISKVSTILKRSILWNVNKPALVSFYRKDYHGNPSIPLDEAVRNTIYEKTGKKIGAHKVLLAREAGNSGELNTLSSENEKGFQGAQIFEDLVHQSKERKSFIETEHFHSVLFLVKRSID